LRAAHTHPNRNLFFDSVVIAYLLAFFSPAVRSLRTLEDFSQTPKMQEQTSTDRIPRSTLSDANKVFDPALLEPIIEELRARIPDLDRQDPKLGELTRRVRAVDSSLFTVAATVISDRIGRLSGSGDCQAPGAMLREIIVIDPNNPDKPLRLLSSILDVPAHVVGELYRWRWKIELFFRGSTELTEVWLKVHANFEHLMSHSENGVAVGFYIAVIAVLLIYIHTQKPVSKYAYVMLGLVATGQATTDDIIPILERRERECALDRLRRARNRAEKTGK
jgi:hypothetical protein